VAENKKIAHLNTVWNHLYDRSLHNKAREIGCLTKKEQKLENSTKNKNNPRKRLTYKAPQGARTKPPKTRKTNSQSFKT
jgi:hypothetical protein